MTVAGSVSVADDGTITKSGLAGNYYDAIYAQESPLFPDRLNPPATFGGTADSWTTRIDAALVKVKKGYARTANALANGTGGGGASAYDAVVADISTASAVYATILTANITTVLPTSFLLIQFSVSGHRLTNFATNYFLVYVDGTAQKGCYDSTPVSYGYTGGVTQRVAVTAGDHVVLVKWKTDSPTTYISGASVPEEHGTLFVQEVG